MADIVTSRIFVDGEKGITAAKQNDIIASSVIQPAFYTSKPTASTADPPDVMLILKAGAYTQVPVSTLAASLSSAAIWSTRLRSFNAVGNPNFEVDQRMSGSANPASGTFIQDRWQIVKVGTMVLAAQVGSPAIGAGPILPGTSFELSNRFLTTSLTTQESSLAAGDLWIINQTIEGPLLRELIGDVHSVSLLVTSSVAGLKFSVALRDPGTTTKSIVKLCTIPTANTWTLIQLPNLPVFPSGNFSTSPGTAGYMLTITLACGTTFTAPAADTWQNGNFVGAPGMSNFANSPVNSTFLLGMVQHEPGAVCSTLMDKTFSQNYDECLRYYQKTYDYGTIPGTVTNNGIKSFLTPVAANAAYGTLNFHKPLAKVPPTISIYNHATGAINSVQDNAGSNHTGASTQFASISGFGNIIFTGNTTGAMAVWAHYAADTGW